LQVKLWSMFPVQDDPQLVPPGGKTQLPLALQSVAPHAPPAGEQRIEQHRDPPCVTPHAPLWHWSSALQRFPGPSFGTHMPRSQ
jgi:hypothetical protein